MASDDSSESDGGDYQSEGLSGSDDDFLLTMPTIPASTRSDISNGELLESLKTSQLFQQQLVQRYKELKKKCMEAESRVPSRTRGAVSWHIQHGTPPDVDPLSPLRYDYAETQSLAIVSELYESLTPALQEELATPSSRQSFKDAFTCQFNQERSNAVHLARDIAGQLLNVDSRIIGSEPERVKSPVLLALLHNPKKPGEKYPLWASMLFSSQDCNHGEPLKVHALRQFIKAFLFGKKACIEGHSVGLTKTTPGMIAAAATMLTFACGPDSTFSAAKSASGVDWGQRHTCYKAFVLKLPLAYRTRLFSWYDEYIFGAKEPVPDNTNTSSAAFNDVDELIQQLSNRNAEPPSSAPPALTSAPPALTSAPPALASPTPTLPSPPPDPSQPFTDDIAMTLDPEPGYPASPVATVDDPVVPPSKGKGKGKGKAKEVTKKGRHPARRVSARKTRVVSG
ncbi:hypothetical protein BC826DRAFT_996021 [Russula brevipes]|nr:hypothetical protein BC826DRAFT_996021 [Russula brevipes]